MSFGSRGFISLLLNALITVRCFLSAFGHDTTCSREAHHLTLESHARQPPIKEHPMTSSMIISCAYTQRRALLLVLQLLLCAAQAHATPDPLTQRQRAMTQVWGQELARWPLYCLSRARASHDPRAGCGDPVRATQARWALLRQRRITGHGGLRLDPQGQERLQPKRWWPMPAPSGADDLDARLEERAWRLALTYESLMSTGDAGWLTPLWSEMASLTSEVNIRCSDAKRSSVPCLSALFWVSVISSTPWTEASPKLFPTLLGVKSESDLERQASWGQHWAQLQAWVKGLTIALLPTVKADASVQHNAAVLLLASVSLDEPTLKEWVSYWRAQGGAFTTERLAAEPSAVAFLLGHALARVATRLGALDLGEVAHQQLKRGVSAYLNAPRDLPLRSQLAMAGLWALSALWEHPHLQPSTGALSGGFGLSYAPRIWQIPDRSHPLRPLPPQGVLSQGLFSKIRVRDHGARRGMYFVRPGNVEVLESELDLDHLELLQVAYTRDFMLSYALTPHHKRALIVGLGGGGMLHALKRYDPTLTLEVVEIDPVVVQLAREHFGVDQTGAELITRDGFEQLRDPKSGRYDVIYMDAFLQPSDETDSTGAPLRLKTVQFLQEVRERLTRQGVLMINLNEHPKVAQDIRSIQAAFESTLVWRVPNTGNLIVAGFNGAPSSVKALYQRATEREALLNGPLRLAPILTRALQAEGI